MTTPREFWLSQDWSSSGFDNRSYEANTLLGAGNSALEWGMAIGHLHDLDMSAKGPFWKRLPFAEGPFPPSLLSFLVHLGLQGESLLNGPTRCSLIYSSMVDTKMLTPIPIWIKPDACHIRKANFATLEEFEASTQLLQVRFHFSTWGNLKIQAGDVERIDCSMLNNRIHTAVLNKISHFSLPSHHPDSEVENTSSASRCNTSRTDLAGALQQSRQKSRTIVCHSSN